MASAALRTQAIASRLGARSAAGRAAVVAAGLSLVTAWIHFAYVADHWRDWWAYGVFFVATGVFQALLAPAIVRWPRSGWVALAGVMGNLAIVSMYVWTRTVGIPMGPHTGVAEKAGAADLATTAAEIALMGILLTTCGSRTRRVIVNILLLIGVALWVARLTDNLHF